MNRTIIHFNNAGTGIQSKRIIKSISSYLNNERKYGGYEFAERFKKETNKLYINLATLLNAKKDEISFIPNTTLGWNLLFSSLSLSKRDEILIFENEYNSNYISILKRKKEFKKIVISKIDAKGLVCEKDLLKNMTRNTKICSLQHISSQCGNKIDVVKICKTIKEYNSKIIIILDCCQSVGQADINVRKIGCDIAVGSGRKYLCGPRGTGFIYINKDFKSLLKPIFEDMSSTLIKQNELVFKKRSKFFESFEQPLSLKLGLSNAVNEILKLGIQRIEAKILSLSKYLRENLNNYKQIIFLENKNNLSGINTFYIKGFNTKVVHQYLKQNNINTQISDAEVSYLYFHKIKVGSVIRLSLHYYNTKKEINFFIKIIKNLLV